jgi:hypothetical protein
MGAALAFAARALLGLVFACAWFGVPGYLVARRVRVAPLRGPAGAALVAPLVGMAIVGPASLCVLSVLPFGRAGLVGAWLAATGALAWWARRTPVLAGPAELAPRPAGALAALAVLGGLAACLGLLPFEHAGGLYVSPAIYDHAKVAFIDSMARDGLPPLNPLYAPGHPASLNYYYLWLFLAAHVRVVTGLAGWPSDVAMTWLTGASLGALVASLAIRLDAGRARAGALALPLLSVGPVFPVLRRALAGAPALAALLPVDSQGFGPAAAQLEWVPQHALAAGAIVLALWQASSLEPRRFSGAEALVLGGLLALVFGCSAWLAVATAVATPVGLAVLFARARPSWAEARGPALTLAAAAGVAALASAPVLASELQGGGASGGFPVAIELYRAVTATRHAAWAHVALYWLVFVPSVYGVAALLGPIGLALARAGDRAARVFVRLAGAASAAFLAVSLFLRSTVATNDLGWRAQIVAYLVLSIGAGVALSALASRASSAAGGTLEARLRRARLPVLAVAAVLFVAGVSTTSSRPPPAPALAELASPEHALRRRFLRQPRVWERVRELTAPTELVQANPLGFAGLVPWPMNLPFVLFADRRSALGDERWAFYYSHHMDEDERAQVTLVVRNVFSAHAVPEAIRALDEGLGVRAVVVDRGDAAWGSRALEDSGVYRVAYADEDVRIYLATRERGGSTR